MDTKFYTSSQQMANDKVERKNNALLKRNIVKDKVNELDWYRWKSTRLNSSHITISYAVFCLKKKTKKKNTPILLLYPLITHITNTACS